MFSKLKLIAILLVIVLISVYCSNNEIKFQKDKSGLSYLFFVENKESQKVTYKYSNCLIPCEDEESDEDQAFIYKHWNDEKHPGQFYDDITMEELQNLVTNENKIKNGNLVYIPTATNHDAIENESGNEIFEQQNKEFLLVLL